MIAVSSPLAPPPSPPGSLTDRPTASQVLTFLDELRVWSTALRDSLAALDRRARVATTPDRFTADLTLALSLSESIDRRYDELVAVWDSGRVLAKELDHIAQLLWGRLPDALGNPSAFSLPEATSLASALEDRLDGQLDADAIAGSGAADRIDPLRETLARCRRLAETLGRRGGEADQLLAELDAALAAGGTPAELGATIERLADAGERLERDLIKETALRSSVEAEAAALGARLAGLQVTEGRVRADAEACRTKIADPPRLAVPDISVLGPVPPLPDGPEAVGAWHAAADRLHEYRDRLDRAGAALAEADHRFAAPMAERAELRGLAEAYRAKAGARGLAEDPALEQAFQAARTILWRAPCDLAAARTAVAAYEAAVQQALAGGRAGAAPPADGRAAHPDLGHREATEAGEPRGDQ